jgi:hypothetical protein
MKTEKLDRAECSQEVDLEPPKWMSLLADGNPHSAEEFARAALNDIAEILKSGVRESHYQSMKARFDAWRTHGHVKGGMIDLEVAINYVVRCAEQGDPSARRACLEAASEFMSAEVVIPGTLKTFIASFCKKAAAEQEAQHDAANRPVEHHNEFRDFSIGFVVTKLQDWFGMNVYRRRNAKKPTESASSLVSRLLGEAGVHITESTIEAIYKAYIK